MCRQRQEGGQVRELVVSTVGSAANELRLAAMAQITALETANTHYRRNNMQHQHCCTRLNLCLFEEYFRSTAIRRTPTATGTLGPVAVGRIETNLHVQVPCAD